MQIEKKLTGKFKPNFHETTNLLTKWLNNKGYTYSYACNADGVETITAKFEVDEEYNEAVLVAEKFERESNPQGELFDQEEE